MFSRQGEPSLISKPPVEIECPEWCNPQSKVVKYSVKWTHTQDWSEIDRLDLVLTLRSPVFRFGQDKELEACIVAYITREERSPLDNIAIYLEMVSSYKSSISGKLEFVCDQMTSRDMMLTQDTITPGRGWGFKDMFQGDYIFPPTYLQGLGKYICKWTVNCSISLVEDKLSAHSAAKPNLGETQTLVNDYQKLLAAGTLSDVTIVVGGERLRAHKSFLSARSPVFAAMFVSEMEEAKSNVVNIVDLDVDVIKEMLNFIYTGRVDLQNSTTEGLLSAADKYGLDDLKAMCEDSLGKNLTAENVCQIFRLSDLHRAHELKVKSAEFMKQNMEKVQETADWKELKDTCSKLIVEVMVEKGNKRLKLF